MNAVIDGSLIETREELHDALAAQLSLPPYYGRTLDALFDCLGDVREDVTLRVTHADALAARLGSYAARLRCLLTDASLENERLIVDWEA